MEVPWEYFCGNPLPPECTGPYLLIVSLPSALLVVLSGALPKLALPLRHSFNRLCVTQSRFHSLAQACSPRRMNRSQPRPILICPNTGSTVCPRSLYSRRPRFDSKARSIRSRDDRCAGGMRPRGGGYSRWALRCFPVLVGRDQQLRPVRHHRREVRVTAIPGISQRGAKEFKTVELSKFTVF